MGSRSAVAMLASAQLVLAGAGRGAPQSAASADSPAVVLKGRAPVSTTTIRVTLPHPVEADLLNGLHVMLLEDHRLPQVHFSLVVNGAGGYYDAPDRVGLATLTAQMLREATATVDAEQIARRLDLQAASLEENAGAASPVFTASGACLTEQLADVLELAADVVLRPKFPPPQLERVKERLRTALLQERGSPFSMAADALARALYADNPAGRTATLNAMLDAATAQDLIAWHRERYVPNRAVLAVAGDISPAALREMADRIFGAWPGSGLRSPAPGEAALPEAATSHAIVRPYSVQTNLMVGAAAVPRSHPDYDALLVMNQVLGAGPTGRLFVKLREEKGYTYGAFSALIGNQTSGHWYARTEVGSAVTTPALRDLLAEIARVRQEPIDAHELQQQKQAIVAGFALTLESPQQLIAYQVTRWLERLPSDYWDTLPDRVMAVSAARVRQVAAQYLSTDRLQIVAVGERASIVSALDGLGPRIQLDESRDLRPASDIRPRP